MKTHIVKLNGLIVSIMSIIVITASASVLAATTQNVDVDVEIPQVLELSWSPLDIGSIVDLTGANKIMLPEFIIGYRDRINGGTLVVSTNSYWDLAVVASADLFTGGSGIKPATDLRIDVDNANTYVYQVSGINPITIFRGQAPNIESHKINYQIALNAQDTAGIYSIDLTYTLIKN